MMAKARTQQDKTCGTINIVLFDCRLKVRNYIISADSAPFWIMLLSKQSYTRHVMKVIDQFPSIPRFLVISVFTFSSCFILVHIAHYLGILLFSTLPHWCLREWQLEESVGMFEGAVGISCTVTTHGVAVLVFENDKLRW